MTHIIAGGLQQQKQVQGLINELKRVVFSENDISSFYPKFDHAKSEMMVGVNVIDAREEAIAIRILRSFGASHIEYSEGKIVNGEWPGFNPVAIPKLIDPIE